jgi:hypothetical protein
MQNIEPRLCLDLKVLNPECKGIWYPARIILYRGQFVGGCILHFTAILVVGFCAMSFGFGTLDALPLVVQRIH